jgi:hypothetical protein
MSDNYDWWDVPDYNPYPPKETPKITPQPVEPEPFKTGWYRSCYLCLHKTDQTSMIVNYGKYEITFCSSCYNALRNGHYD